MGHGQQKAGLRYGGQGAWGAGGRGEVIRLDGRPNPVRLLEQFQTKQEEVEREAGEERGGRFWEKKW